MIANRLANAVMAGLVPAIHAVGQTTSLEVLSLS
jgi:hypothetical protein